MEIKKIEFNEKNFGVMSMDIGWCNVYCPYCNLYNSRSFLFNLEKGKKEYTGKCERCGEKAIIDMGTIEQNDKLMDTFERSHERLMANGNTTLGEFA